MVRGIANSKIGFGNLILLLRYFFKLKVSTHPNYLKFIQISYLEKIDELFREIKKAPEGAFFIVSLVIPTKQFKEIRNVSNN